MAETKLELPELVSPAQDTDTHSLRKILDLYEIEDELPEYRPESHGRPIELGNEIYIWELKEDLPEELEDATYIIIDTIFFSTTAIEALSNGVDAMYLKESHGKVLEVKERHGLVVGGEGSREYGPREGFDFFNSPSNARKVSASEVAMTSDNGAIAALKAFRRSPESSEVYIGSTTNARALAGKVDGNKPVHIVCSGSKGSYAAEDHIAAYMIARYIAGQPLERWEIKVVEDLLDIIQDYIYDEVPDIRQIDIQEHVKDLNSRESVPELVENKGYVLKAH